MTSRALATTMKPTGHFWCEHCDDLAFGRLCQRCHRPALWIEDRPPLHERIEQHQEAHTHTFTPVDEATARARFREMIENLGRKN